MAAGGSEFKMSEETFECVCSACAEENLIKQALKYCVECQQYCCKDCLTSHRRIASLKSHSFLDNSSATPQGQPKSLPVLPTKQCSKHVGMIMYMYCQDHDVVCCYICAAEDHRSCKDIKSISDNINQLYNKNDTSTVTSEVSRILDDIKEWQTNTDNVLQQLGASKVTAIKAVKDYRIEMEKILKKLEEESIKEIEEEFKKLESQILEEKKRFEDCIDDLKNLQQLFRQASGNIAQLFIYTKLAEKKCSNIGDNEMESNRFDHAEVKFLPSEDLKSSMEKNVNLGEASSNSSSKNNKYDTATNHAEDKCLPSKELESSMKKMENLGKASLSKDNMCDTATNHAEEECLPSEELESSIKKMGKLGEESSSPYDMYTATEHVEDKFLPSIKLESSKKKMEKLGEASSSKNNMYTATKIHDINVKIKGDIFFHICWISDSCIMADTVIFTDRWNHKLKRFDVSSSSLIDHCEVPLWPRGICKIADKEIAVACRRVVQFVSVGDKLSLSRSIKMKHESYGLAYSNNKLYITDEDKLLYMYDMCGNLLKTITRDNGGQPLFECCDHIIFNDKNDRLFVGDRQKGLVCFNAECEYTETITDPDVRPGGVCVDGDGNIIVANIHRNTITQCDRDGHKRGIIVNKTQGHPRSVCIHHGQRKMFVGYESNTVEVYCLTRQKV